MYFCYNKLPFVPRCGLIRSEQFCLVSRLEVHTGTKQQMDETHSTGKYEARRLRTVKPCQDSNTEDKRSVYTERAISSYKLITCLLLRDFQRVLDD